MESIKELRKICQSEMSHADTWQDKLICRRFSIYITRLLLPTPITAIQASWILLIIGFIPGIFFIKNQHLAGVIALQLWYIFDGVDGEIARYKKQTSLTGAYFDHIIHYVIHPYIFLTIGIGLFFKTESKAILLSSITAAFSLIMISMINDAKRLVILEKNQIRGIQDDDTDPGEKPQKMSIFKIIFSSLYKICTYPTIMNILTVAALLNLLIPDLDLFKYLIVFYGATTPLIWIAKVYVNIRKKINN